MDKTIRNRLCFVLSVVCTLLVPADADYCSTGTGYKYCEYGCCDNGCCEIGTGQIVGMVIGGVMMLAMIIAIIACCICYFKSRGRENVVPYNSNTVVVSTVPGHYPQYSQPQGYSHNRSYPSYNDSVYPPGLVNQPNYDNNYGTGGNSGHPPPYYPPTRGKSKK